MGDSNVKTFTTRDKKKLMEKVEDLSSTEHEEIFKLLRSYDVQFSQNKSGMFINLKQVSNIVLTKVDQFVDFCIRNNSELDEYDKRIIECKLKNNFDALDQNRTERKQLNDIICAENHKKTEENWQKVIVQNKEDIRVANFASMLEESLEGVHKKKGSMKYVNAKKKFARRIVNTERKIDYEMANALDVEPYIILSI